MVLAPSRNSQNIGLRGYPIHTMRVRRPSVDVAFTLSGCAAARTTPSPWTSDQVTSRLQAQPGSQRLADQPKPGQVSGALGHTLEEGAVRTEGAQLGATMVPAPEAPVAPTGWRLEVALVERARVAQPCPAQRARSV